ncbi:4-methylaminobutanoate oxidase (formaldehyde-forming) [Halomicronema hongdechloris C2206]|uniref:4-methylaminobutanoate oxidase (Formaldehyde-forming) n=1 Tax=Halomicronema hongdechloris C2206 TaxID=1641165 RepID=A0A1Z3HK42_9CYAN|nr:FAD-binding oxidoreductase [Halomicronema hongdechloris]ASC70682.1 4-methylaminobutanoate oxidase (formaldehyde-forming) [Halomicronema hongdechloris C2206]
MPTFDWIVVGNGLAGAALSYELARQQFSVLLLDRALQPASATRFSYGGIPYWAGTTPLTRQLCREGIERHRQLSEELGIDTQFRELDLVLTIAAGAEVETVAAPYRKCAIPPQLISAAAAQQLDPLLDASTLAAALTVRHGHVSPTALVAAYNHGFQQLGGTVIIAPVTGLVRIGERVTGVTTPQQAYAAGHVAIAAGGYSRVLLKQADLPIPLYYTHAELIETPPLDLTLRTLVMPADAQRFQLEAQVSAPTTAPLWEQPGREIAPPILDSGAIQFQDGHLCIGQISRALSDLEADIDAQASETQLRAAICRHLPSLKGVPGTWHHCLVSFSRDGLPLVGPVANVTGVQVFTGFSSPFALLPPTAQRFAAWATGKPDDLIKQMTPARFTS